MLTRKVSLKTIALTSPEKLNKTKRDIFFYTPFSTSTHDNNVCESSRDRSDSILERERLDSASASSTQDSADFSTRYRLILLNTFSTFTAVFVYV